MAISAPQNNSVDTGLPTTPEQVDDPKAFNEFMLVYRAIKNVAARLVAGSAAQMFNAAMPTTDMGVTPRGYFTPIDGTADTTDRTLGVGQSKFINVSAATSVLLRIACGDGQEYELDAFSSDRTAYVQTTYLNPNNTAYGSVFSLGRIYGANASTPVSGIGAIPNFYLSMGTLLMSRCIISTSTAMKYLLATTRGTDITTNNYYSFFVALWSDTTTVWSSLGTVQLGSTWTGRILIRRIA